MNPPSNKTCLSFYYIFLGGPTRPSPEHMRDEETMERDMNSNLKDRLFSVADRLRGHGYRLQATNLIKAAEGLPHLERSIPTIGALRHDTDHSEIPSQDTLRDALMSGKIRGGD